MSKRLLVWTALPFLYLDAHRPHLPHETCPASASPPLFFSFFKITAVLTIHTLHFGIQLYNALSCLTTLGESLVPLGIKTVGRKWVSLFLLLSTPQVSSHTPLHIGVVRVGVKHTLVRNEINPIYAMAPPHLALWWKLALFTPLSKEN